jgi:hypothetical protein
LRRCRLLLGKDGLQHIAGFGDVGKVNLGLEAFAFRLGRARALGSVPIARSFEMGADLLRFVIFERGGMRFFLGDADFRQHIENGFALDLQLSRQIVDSNLAHPPLSSLGVPVKSSWQPHVSVGT